MCGIAGIFAYHYAANPVDREELLRIRDHMAARGPDGKGAWFSEDGRIGFGHRRLSIIDLTDGRRPTHGERRRQACRDLQRRDLQLSRPSQAASRRRAGSSAATPIPRFFSTSMPRRARRWCTTCAACLLSPSGIRSAGLCSCARSLRHQAALLCRRWVDAAIRLAGEGAFGGGAQSSRDPEPAGWVGFCLFGSVPEPYTTYQEIRALPAGTTLWVDRIGPREPKPYFSIAAMYRQAESDGTTRSRSAVSLIREALVDSVRHHLVADVPVGAFLSAGVDSGALVGLMRDCGQADIQTVTLAFEEFLGTSEDEAPIASEVAAQYGTRHTTRVVTEREFREDLPKILDAMDQPTIDGINTWFVSKAARELGLKVAISGLGGDELFGGYPSFRDLPRWTRMLRVPSRIPLLGEFARRALIGLRAASPKAAGMLKYGGSYAGAYLLRRGLFMPWELE